MDRKFRSFHFIILLAVAPASVTGYYAWQVLTMGAAYKAKLLCTNTFFAARDPDKVLQEDLNGPEKFLNTKIDYREKSVTAWLPGIPMQKAIFVDNLGCVLLAGADETDFRRHAADWVTSETNEADDNSATLLFNLSYPSSFDQQKLTDAIDQDFAGPNRNNANKTRAIIVLHDGGLIVERYAPGFSENTPFLGWSMTKSVINALVGILVKQGKLSLEQSTLVKEWSNRNDPRSKITLDQLLRMSSGLEFDETTGAVISDVTRMLFRQQDVAAYAIAKPLKHAPNTFWKYASGTSNIISSIAREATGGGTASVAGFLQNELFRPLGIVRAFIEPDTSGNLIGSSFMYATAREWARFGQLFLNDGIWGGKQLLPKGWVQYSSTPTPTAGKSQYGAHFWTNGGTKSEPNSRPFPKLPGDLFYAAGYKGQRVIIIPSHKLVIVRLGWTDDYNMGALAVDILAAKSVKLD